LGAIGASAWGILAAGARAERPDLFSAVEIYARITSTLRFPLTDLGNEHQGFGLIAAEPQF